MCEVDVLCWYIATEISEDRVLANEVSRKEVVGNETETRSLKKFYLPGTVFEYLTGLI